MTMIKQNPNDVEIRKLPAGAIFQLCHILDSNDGWKELMAVVPIACVEGNDLKYTVEDIKAIENEGVIQKCSCTAIFLEEWGTSGKCRPTISFLLKCLMKAQLYRAVEYVAQDLLKGPLPPRPTAGPAAPVLWSLEHYVPSAPPIPDSTDSLHHIAPVLDIYPSAQDHSSSSLVTPPDSTKLVGPVRYEVVKLSYSELKLATDGFAEQRVLGVGAFGKVYWANLPNVGAVAVKRIHDNGTVGDPVGQFHNEVEVLAQLKHTNLLPLLGYSDNGPALCLAYKYMRNGSLLDQLASQNNKTPLLWRTRVEIGLGTARGLCHLHTALKKPLVHRDVKSANILLDDNLTPKLGDFGLVRQGSQGLHTHTAALTTTAMGTSAYMAPEAHRGDVSVKMDIFSFGVVLLELITGLPPYDESREGHDLITHVDEVDDNEALLDKKAGNWPQNVSTGMFQLATDCLKNKKQKRPDTPTLITRLKPFLS